ncbi:SgcJ/EcaC family oxidoreductase [Amycolatopsis sp. lyj-108]|uniref:SgcJ/EcaC family oxidoreductase n=1 Tax=Amycolatopsis sp. lyj-108 TaxID=2789286 RepID=UPI00397E34B8
MTVRPLAHDIPGDEEDIRAITAVFTELEAAFAEHDAAKFDARFAEDVIFTAVNGVRFTGWDDIHAYHQERLEHHAEGIRTWYEIDRITFPAPGAALVFVRQPVRTEHGTRSNIGTWVLSKKDGQWWVAAIQNTAVAA